MTFHVEQNKQHLCPCCDSDKSANHLLVKDHFLSGETFQLLKCGSCDLIYTTPRPPDDKIGDYYKSEEYVSHSSTKKGVVNLVYNAVRRYTLSKKVRLVKNLVSGKALLDVGAGTGHFLKRAQNNGFSVLGLEPDADARRVGREQLGVGLKDLSDLYDLPKGHYDVLTMWHVLEHVYDLKKDTEQFASLVKPGGVLIIAVPNYMSYDATYYKEFWAAYDVPRHLYHFSPDSIIPFVEQFGLTLEKMLPMKFDAYYISMISEKYRGGSLLNALKIGFKSNRRSRNGKCSSQTYVFRKK